MKNCGTLDICPICPPLVLWLGTTYELHADINLLIYTKTKIIKYLPYALISLH